VGFSTADNGHGGDFTGNGSGPGCNGFGGAGGTGAGGSFTGGSGGGFGVKGLGLLAAAGVVGVGGATGGAGQGAGGHFSVDTAGNGSPSIQGLGGPLMLNQVSPATPVANSLYADGIPKAWGTITTNGSSGAQSWAGMNIASAHATNTGTGIGKITVTFETPAAAGNLYTIPMPSFAQGVSPSTAISVGWFVNVVSASVVDFVCTLDDPSASPDLTVMFNAYGLQ
jgi:hypothetical protein